MTSTDPLKHEGEVRTEMDCTHCSKHFIALVDYSLNGNHNIECPFCGHEHCRVVTNGKITGERWSSTTGDKRDAHRPRRVWKANSLPVVTTTRIIDMATTSDITAMTMFIGSDAKGWTKVSGVRSIQSAPVIPDKFNLWLGKEVDITLPDGSHLLLDKTGAYRIEDANAKITYKANRVREFNRYVNASDMLEEFIHYLISLGLDKQQIVNIPINLFIAFLIVRAAEADGEPKPEAEAAQLQLLALPAPQGVAPALPSPREDPAFQARYPLRPRCVGCGRFILKALASRSFLFCNPEHAQRAYARIT